MSLSEGQRAALRIAHMLEAITGVSQIIGSANSGAVAADWVKARALERGFEIISEASRHIPGNLKATEPHIPWRQVAGLGNVLRHDYDGVEIALLLVSAKSDLPELQAALHRILDRLNSSGSV